jgi:hypothetical protein
MWLGAGRMACHSELAWLIRAVSPRANLWLVGKVLTGARSTQRGNPIRRALPKNHNVQDHAARAGGRAARP